jgi:hypothetical protein
MIASMFLKYTGTKGGRWNNGKEMSKRNLYETVSAIIGMLDSGMQS